MMRKLLLLIAAIIIAHDSKAAVGDTTWVQAHNDVWLTYFGNYDTAVGFPDGSKTYRKIYMIVTLGKYVCPGNPQYCGDWDYTVQHFLMPKTGDTLELGRLITPYANSGSPRTPQTWKEQYVYDVTDYYPVLKDSARLRVHYSGYSGGFTSNIKFAFIEGTPTRNVIGIDRLWHGSFAFGKAADPIENYFQALTKTAPANAVATDLKFTISGHGSDGNYCSEFCSKYYQVKLNGSQVAQKDIWRDNCGKNHLYPQSGTWVYDRANWCPGDIVFENSHDLSGISAGSGYNVDIDFENYSDNGSASYIVEARAVYYGGFNHTTDADLTEIVAPNNHEMYFRENPSTTLPVIKVRNNGSNAITSLKIESAVNNSSSAFYTWQGSIAPLTEATITLPESWDLRTATGNGNTFSAKIVEVNGSADADPSNNALRSYFTAAPQWPMDIIVIMTTNKAVAGGVSENSWKIIDALGNTVAERKNASTQTTYRDTVRLGPGAFRFIVNDEGCDGINFWANVSQAGAGSISVRSLASVMPFALSGNFSGDFGCGFTQAFNTNWPSGIQQVNGNDIGIAVYPNPAGNEMHMALSGIDKVSGAVKIMDAVGRIVLQQQCYGSETKLNTSQLSNGIYNIQYVGASGEKLQARMIIKK